MKVAVGSDHGGFQLKTKLVGFLKEKGHEVLDLGIYSPEAWDYPDAARVVSEAILRGEADRVAGAAPITGALLGIWGWRTALIVEGALPFLWLPIWWIFAIRDHPREAKWISKEEREYLETTLAWEAAQLAPTGKQPLWKALVHPAVFVMVPIYFLQNCAAYGTNTFLSEALKGPGRNFTPLQTGLLYAAPYAVAAVCMVLNSWHSDKTQERRGHVALVYSISGVCLIASVLASRSPDKDRSYAVA